ncbi:hypothetical protein C5B42_00930 [Candidatus Cerribacteria bacterium 'Amazon FNV 2010 28 9']|uniref:Phosphatidic acid phosphatase type 2/haloperoxidase domain-containing protein n=1 Tax=Candidatus Cerribacteria bacterium 'Amazon FNV 2010 28 9' TaxID=2081795 RepID=A0A317JV05_9BACT|nr:MAG: hypothetical protein C5B42_00930 [Candidatus Cerribacteria bacterium 'Amazon FNV 2010 28 9']
MSLNQNRKLYLIYLLCLFGIFLGITVRWGLWQPLDLAISHTFQSLQPTWLVKFNQLLSSFEIGIVFIIFPLFVYFKKKKNNKEAYFILAAGLSWFVMRILKLTFGVPCPTAHDVQLLYGFHNIESEVSRLSNIIKFFDPDVCYPSGHVFDFIMVWGTIFTLRQSFTKNKKAHQIIGVIALSLIILIGQARISLGAHWFTDVIGGYLFGIAWLLILRWVFIQSTRE